LTAQLEEYLIALDWYTSIIFWRFPPERYCGWTWTYELRLTGCCRCRSTQQYCLGALRSFTYIIECGNVESIQFTSLQIADLSRLNSWLTCSIISQEPVTLIKTIYIHFVTTDSHATSIRWYTPSESYTWVSRRF